MAVIASEGRLAAVQTAPAAPVGGLRLFGGYTADYATVYRTQPAVRTVVSFLARNIASLGLHVYRRVSESDRERVRDHALAGTLGRPNAHTTPYRLIHATMSDFAIFDAAYWAKVTDRDGAVTLLRLPPSMVSLVGDSWVRPDGFELRGNRGSHVLAPDEVVYFRGYDPDSARSGVSPIETLRQTLAEEHAANVYREQHWRNGARMSGILKRPPGAPPWSDVARARFRSDWNSAWAGGGTEVGGTPLLEEGMEYEPAAATARESQYIESRKLTREEVAAAYHIPPTMVGILDHATFSNISEQHKHTYQDTLGPYLAMLEQEIVLQLLPDYTETAGIYVEFNLMEKLKGSFEEQSAALQSGTGRPWMTANEARARLNLPSLGAEGDGLVTPLNVLVGGQASPRDTAPPPKTARSGAKSRRDTVPYVAKHVEVLEAFFGRQGRVVRSKLGAKAAPTVDEVFDRARWDAELRDDLLALSLLTADAFATATAERFGVAVSVERMEAWLAVNARVAAEQINDATVGQLEEALESDDVAGAVVGVFAVAAGARAAQIAQSRVTSSANFGAHDAARQAGLASKTWVVNSSNPRPTHAAVNGETVPVGERFSIGGMWPGDPSLGVEETAGCSCTVEFDD